MDDLKQGILEEFVAASLGFSLWDEEDLDSVVWGGDSRLGFNSQAGIGGFKKGQPSNQRVLTVEQVQAIRSFKGRGADGAVLFGVSKATINRIRSGETYKEIR